MPYIPSDISYIPNTRMEFIENALGTRIGYAFTPSDGYVLHLKRDEAEDVDPETGNTIGTIIMFARGKKTVNINYDFSIVVNDVYTYTDENGMTVNVPIQKIGQEEMYTLPESVVPADNIYGSGNDHVVASTTPDTETETE